MLFDLRRRGPPSCDDNDGSDPQFSDAGCSVAASLQPIDSMARPAGFEPPHLVPAGRSMVDGGSAGVAAN